MSSLDHRTIKASFKDCLVSDRKKFSQSHCLMPISVGQPVHEGKKFLATVKLINASFKECTLLVDDSVQRHTMAISNSHTPEEMYARALQSGNDWLERNKRFYSHFTIPFHVMRWDDWFKTAVYKEKHEKVKKAYREIEFFRKEFDSNIHEFLSRHISRLDDSNIDPQRAYTLCLDYLFEECAVMQLWPEQGYHFEVYPTGRNRAMAATYHYLIQSFYPNLLKSVSLRFKKYGTLSTHS